MFDNVEDLFKQLDSNPYKAMVKQYVFYRDALLEANFTRRESMRIVEDFAKLTHEAAFEDGYKEDSFFSSRDNPEEDTEDS